jgi:hypothetical protein
MTLYSLLERPGIYATDLAEPVSLPVTFAVGEADVVAHRNIREGTSGVCASQRVPLVDFF